MTAVPPPAAPLGLAGAQTGGEPGAVRFDFQTFLPESFDDRPFDVSRLVELADEAGVDRFVVMPVSGQHPDNAGVARRIAGERRAVMCAAVNPREGPDAVAELERSFQHHGARGLRLYPIAHGYALTDACVDPLLRLARAQGVPVTTDSCAAGCHPAQVDRIAERFPDLTIIADVGFRPLAPPVSLGLDPPPEGRIADVAAVRPNVYLGLAATATAETYLIKRILGAVGVEKLVFGSGAPWGIPAFSVGGVRQARLGQQAEARFLGETLARLYSVQDL